MTPSISLIKLGQLQTNCMVERFNGRISDVNTTRRHLKQCPGADVDMLLLTVQSTYSAEGSASSITDGSDEEWQPKRPVLFTKRLVKRGDPKIK